MKIKSPITNSFNVVEIEKISVDKIRDRYRGIGFNDMERFFHDLKTISICKCLDSNYRFYYPGTVIGDEQFYIELMKLNGYYHSWRWEHEDAFSIIERDKEILEIGCGTGNFLDKLKKEKNITETGLEFSEKAFKSAKEKGLNVFKESIKEHAAKNENKYDVVCLFQVLEHVYDVNEFLTDALHCLKKDGLLIVGVPNNNPYLFKNDIYHTLNLPPHHVGLWDKSSLSNMVNFFPVSIETLKAEPLLETEYFWIINKEYWSKNSFFLRQVLKIFDVVFLKGVKNILLSNIFEGRNLLAVYRKI